MKTFTSIALSFLIAASFTLGGALTAVSFHAEKDTVQIVVRPMDELPIGIARS